VGRDAESGRQRPPRGVLALPTRVLIMEPSRQPLSLSASGGLPMASSPSGSAIDPVCGMRVDPEHAAASTVHEGKPYYFCHPNCLRKFQAAPARYLAPAPLPAPAVPQPPPAAPPGTKIEYTCPMHPEVVSAEPGACPKCGMALEPRTLVLEEG